MMTAPPRPPERQHSSAGTPPQRRLTKAWASNALDSLTDAIVAGSLASARLAPHNTGASLPPPTLPKRQRSPRLLQTLRQPPSAADALEAERLSRGHRHKLHSAKHAHHESSRRR